MTHAKYEMTSIERAAWTYLAMTGELRDWLANYPVSATSQRAYEERLAEVGREMREKALVAHGERAGGVWRAIPVSVDSRP